MPTDSFGGSVSVSEEQVRQFTRAVKNAIDDAELTLLQNLRLEGRSNPGLQISFDAKWEPFLGHTIGYNSYSKPPRIPIAEPCQVLGRAELWLQRANRGTQGGRVFLIKDGVVCDQTLIGSWEWRGEPPLLIVRQLLYARLAK